METMKLQTIPAVLLIVLLSLQFLALKFLPEQAAYAGALSTAIASLAGALFIKEASKPADEAPLNGQQLPPPDGE